MILQLHTLLTWWLCNVTEDEDNEAQFSLYDEGVFQGRLKWS